MIDCGEGESSKEVQAVSVDAHEIFFFFLTTPEVMRLELLPYKRDRLRSSSNLSLARLPSLTFIIDIGVALHVNLQSTRTALHLYRDQSGC